MSSTHHTVGADTADTAVDAGLGRPDELDRDAYLARIGFDGDRTATVPILQALVAAHTTSIPFENIEPVLGREVPLEVAALQDKLVAGRRGGYCYENAVLFAAALSRLGFGVTGLSARVTLGATGIRVATHALLRVTTDDDDRVWIADVGFGSGPAAAYELVETGEIVLGGWRFRLERDRTELGGDLWRLHQFAANGWIDRYTFTLDPQYLADFRVGNHYVATSAHSPFTQRLFAQRFHADRHVTLDATTVTTVRPDGSSDQYDIAPADVPAVLAETFDIEVSDADAVALVARSSP